MKYPGNKRYFLFLLMLCLVLPARTKAQERESILKDLESILENISSFEPDRTRAWQREYLEVMTSVYQDPGLIGEAEKLMVKALREGASGTGSRLICRDLGVIGSDFSVPFLAELLGDPGMSDVALLALENIPGSSSGAALRKALDSDDPVTKIAVMGSLGVRKDMESVSRIGKLAAAPDPQVAEAAIRALGRIGGEKAASVLEARFKKSAGDSRWMVAEALLACTESLHAGKANQVCRTVYESGPPLQIKYAALQGLFLTSGEEPPGFLAGHLGGDDTEYHRKVIGLIHLIPDPSGLAMLFEEVPGLPELSKLYLMNVLSDAGDLSVRPVILEMLEDEDQVTRISALKALPGVGSAGDVRVLAAIAAGTGGLERDMARQSLNMLPAPHTGDSIVAAILSSGGAVKAELVRSAGERNMTEVTGLLIASASGEDRTVKTEAIRALGKMGHPGILPVVTALLVEAGSNRERLEAEQAILALLQKMPEDSDRSSGIIESLEDQTSPAAASSLISILGQLGESPGLPVLRKSLGSGEKEIRLAAIRALSVWPDAAPFPDLVEILDTTSDERTHTLALRGATDLVIRDRELSVDEKLDRVNRLWELSVSDGEKKSVISGLGKIRSVRALDRAMELVRQGVSKPEAETAVLTIAEGTGWDDPEATRVRLNEFLGLTEDADHTADAEQILERINR